MVAVKCVVAGVVLDDAVLPFAGVDVGVDLGGEYAFVAEHLLYGAEVGSVFDQVGGEGVAECVWGYLLGDACLFALALDHQEYHLAAQLSAAPVQEQDILGFFGYVCTSALREIQLYGLHCRLSDRYKSLFVTLSYYPYESLVEEQVGDAQGHQLAHPETAGVEDLQYCAVAVAFGLGQVYRVHYPVNLLYGQDYRYVPGYLGRVDGVGGVDLYPAFYLHEPEETFQGTYQPGLASLGDAVGLLRYECAQVLPGDILGGFVFVFAGQFGYVGNVRGDRVFRQSPFDDQI